MSEQPEGQPPSDSGARDGKAKLGFEMRKLRLPLDRLLPVKQIKSQHNVKRYQAIVSSIREVGMIEPLMVHPQKGSPGLYLLLDGHLRLLAFKQLGESEAECLIATDDESFTYNARVSRLPPIQCHRMIVKAVKNGVSTKRIAAALDMPLKMVTGLMTLLDGINEEAADMLKDKNIIPKAISLLRKVSGVRQIEIAELMVGANNFTVPYAEALVLGTPKDQLLNPTEPKVKQGLAPEEIARMEREMESLERDFKAVESGYSENMMALTVARGYVKKLLENGKVVRYLNNHHQEILTEFEAIAATEGL
jgi:hypothetical protein